VEHTGDVGCAVEVVTAGVDQMEEGVGNGGALIGSGDVVDYSCVGAAGTYCRET
jgi:hypothetical protein